MFDSDLPETKSLFASFSSEKEDSVLSEKTFPFHAADVA
jgi:hypothetical protein